MQYFKIKRFFSKFIWILLLGITLYSSLRFIKSNRVDDLAVIGISAAALLLHALLSWCHSLYYIEVSGTTYLLNRKNLFHPEVAKKADQAITDRARYNDSGIDILNALDILLWMQGITADLKHFKKKRAGYSQYILKTLELKKCFCGICFYKAAMNTGKKRYIFSIGTIPGSNIKKL